MGRGMKIVKRSCERGSMEGGCLGGSPVPDDRSWLLWVSWRIAFLVHPPLLLAS